MSYRKEKSKSKLKKRWNDFLDRNKELILLTGLPLEYYNKELFEDFMMHGYIDHHIVESKITINDLTDYQIDKLKVLIENYFEYGFLNPGIIIFDQKFKDHLKSKYPDSFS